MRDRLMVGRLILDQVILVRAQVPQPSKKILVRYEPEQSSVHSALNPTWFRAIPSPAAIYVNQYLDFLANFCYNTNIELLFPFIL